MAIEFKEDRIVFGNLLSNQRIFGSDEPTSILLPAETPVQKNTAGDCAAYSFQEIHDKMKEDGQRISELFSPDS